MEELKTQLAALQKQLDEHKVKLDEQSVQLEKAATDLKAAKEASDAAATELTKSQTEITELKKAAAQSTQSEAEKEQEFLKTLPEAFRKQFEDQRVALAKAEAIARDVEFKKTVGENMSHLTGDEASRVAVVKAISKLSADEQKSVLAVLKAANEVIKESGLMQERGSIASDEQDGSAEQKLNGIAKSLIEAKKATNLGDALVLAGKQNPELYREYVAERTAR